MEFIFFQDAPCSTCTICGGTNCIQLAALVVEGSARGPHCWPKRGLQCSSRRQLCGPALIHSIGFNCALVASGST